MADVDDEIAELQKQRKESSKVGFGSTGQFDTDLYGGSNKGEYVTSIAANDDDDMEEAEVHMPIPASGGGKATSYTAPVHLLRELERESETVDDPFKDHRASRVSDRDDDYKSRRRNRVISPERVDPFADKTPDVRQRTYHDVMAEARLEKEERVVMEQIKKKKEEEAKRKKEEPERERRSDRSSDSKKRRFDQEPEEKRSSSRKKSEWDAPDLGGATPLGPGAGGATPGGGVTPGSRWDAATPSRWDSATPNRWDAATPKLKDSDATPARRGGNRWDETPTPGRSLEAETPARGSWDEQTPKTLGGATPSMATPTPGGSKRQRSRWDETPMGATPSGGGVTPGGATVKGGFDMATPTPGQLRTGGPVTPEMYNTLRWEREIDERNRPLTDEELDSMFPTEGYEILDPPGTYQPIRTPSRKLLATPTPAGTPSYQIPAAKPRDAYDIPGTPGSGLPFTKPEDYQTDHVRQYFAPLLKEEDEDALSPEEQKERKIMKLLLKVRCDAENSSD